MKTPFHFPSLSAVVAVLFLSIATAFAQCDPIVVTADEPYFEDFAGDGFACWTLADTLHGGRWVNIHGSDASALAFTYSSDSTGAEARIISPVFDLSGAASAQLSFVYFLYAFYSADEIMVSYRTSETDTWHTLGTLTTISSNYLEQSYPLTDLSSTYQISFWGRDMGGLLDYITNIEITVAGGCARPTSVQVSDIATTSAVLSWTANNGETSWTLELDGVESPVNVNSNPFTLTGLFPQTHYTVRIKANCDTDNSSDWSTPVVFHTECGVYPVTDDNPYRDDFEGDDVFVCWTSEPISGTDDWVLDFGYLIVNNSAFFSWLGDEARLISLPLDLTAVTDPYLFFKRKQSQGYTDVDALSVWYRTSATDEWHSIAQYLFPTNGYEQAAVALPQPSATYQIAFQAKSNNAEGVYVDDVVVGDFSVGISDNQPFEVAVYPNPTTGYVTVESDAVGADITVFDAFGKLMMSSKVAAERTELNFCGFASGVYMVRIATTTGVSTFKVVKE